MLADLDSQQLADWIAYSNVYPVGNDRLDILFAHLAATVINSQGGKRGGEAASIQDCIIDWEVKYAEPQSTADIKAKAEAFFRLSKKGK
jgi:hypothetical protein